MRFFARTDTAAPTVVQLFKRIETALIIVLILLLPFFAGSTHYVGLAVSGGLLFAMLVTSVLGFSIAGGEELRVSPFEILGSIVLVAAGLSALQATFPAGAWAFVGGMLLLGVGYRVARSAAEEFSFAGLVAFALIAGGIIQSLLALHQYFFTGWYAESFPGYFKEFMEFNMRGGSLRVIGGFINPNSLAAFLNLCFGLALAILLFRKLGWSLRVALGFLVVIFLIVIVLTASKAGMAAAFALASVLLVLRDRRMLILVVALAVLLLAVPNPVRDQYLRSVVSDPYLIMRTHIWAASLHMAFDYPLLGVGPDNYRFVSHRYEPPTDMLLVRYSHTPSMAHNSYLHALDEFGIVGFLPLALMLAAVLSGIWILCARQWSRGSVDPYLLGFGAGIFSLMLHSLVDNVAHTRCLLALGLFLFAPIAAFLGGQGSPPARVFDRRFRFPVKLPFKPFPFLPALVLMAGFAVAQVIMPYIYETRLSQIRSGMYEAINQLREAPVSGSPTDFGEQRQAAVAKLRSSIAELENLAEFYPAGEAVLRNVGTAHSELFRATGDIGSFNLALISFEAAEAAMPGRGFSPNLQLNLYFDLAKLGYQRVDAAGELLDTMERLAVKSVRDWPTRAFYHHLAATVARARGERDKAVERLKQALELEPNYLRAIFDLYSVANSMGDEETASEAFEMYKAALSRIKSGSLPEAKDSYAHRILEPPGVRLLPVWPPH